MFLRILNRTEEAIICLLLVLTTLLVFADVVMRFGFNSGFMWTQELTLHMSAWFVLFGASYGIKVGSHIGMDAFVKLFPPLGRRILTAIGCLLGLLYCGLVLYGSWIYLAKVKKIGIELEDLPIPAWIAHGMLIVGFTFLSIRILLLLRDVIIGRADGFRHADEAKESMEIVEELSKEEGLK
ncbi:C4-dicarboxylate ABC transporter permease [Desulfolithobacter dissulfuricans]|uniref:C4-dicarboxylate ABC transporter permease n=1 Tax=Desulfolithobacter dissulfuricans TaxID=2795293 RepID=A0A915XK39_9BACT|nr:TRAP transporter small permease [Desulfolithobacter dissulfuricans]BCO08713.1 C4-dicarboxylate ABC transporter permease [Desulfolithobacter dissulfuricans]